MNKALYYLALSGPTLKQCIEYNLHGTTKAAGLNYMTKDLRFYRKASDSYVYHPNVLLSAVHFHKLTQKHNKSVGELLGIDEDTNIFIDSGGYSLATGAVKRDKWTDQIAFDLSIKNGNIFPILDIPVTPEADFNENLRISRESAEYYKANKPGGKEIILNVAHGRNIGEVKRWIDDISKVQLDGWALGSSHKGNPKEILKGMFYMLTSGVLKDSKAFHIFGVSNAEINIYISAILHAIKRNELEFKFDLTFDSSYPFRTGAFANYFMFMKADGFSPASITNRVDWSTIRDDDFSEGFFCDCPACTDIAPRFGDMMRNDDGVNDRGTWIGWHNFHEILKYKKKVNSLVEMCSDVNNLAQYIFPSRIAKNIEVINEAFYNIQGGEELINRKFIAPDVESVDNTLDSFFS